VLPYLFGSKVVLLYKKVTTYAEYKMSGDMSRNENEPNVSLVTELIAARLSWMVKPAASNDPTGCASKFEGYPGYSGAARISRNSHELGRPLSAGDDASSLCRWKRISYGRDGGQGIRMRP
jgi:hypothetical protein